MNKKIVGFLMCMLLLIPVLSSTVIANQEPKIEIGKIRGRSRFIFGGILIIEIKNIGDADAQNVTYSIRTKHPIFKILDLTLEDTIDMIKAGDTKELTPMLSWIGRFKITVTACVPGGDPVTKTVNGFSILGIIIIFPE
jgi:hypothetical protein